MATPQQRRSSSWANDSPQHPRAALPAAFKIDHRQKSSLWPKAMGRWQREALTEGPWRNVAAPPPPPAAAVPLPMPTAQGGTRHETTTQNPPCREAMGRGTARAASGGGVSDPITERPAAGANDNLVYNRHMPQNKNQHFVPKVYLRQFSNADVPSINLYTINSDKLVQNASIKHQCSRNYFYGTESVFENFIQHFEGQYGTIMSSLADGIVTEGQLDTLLRFLVLQLLRTPHMLQQRFATFEAFKNTEIGGKTIAEMEDKEFLNFTASREMQQQIYMAAKENDVLSDLTIRLLYNKTKYPFITSDNPAFYLNRLYSQRFRDETSGLIQSGLIAGLPLNSSLFLLAYDADVYKPVGRDHVYSVSDPADVIRLNEIQIQTATNTLFFEDWNDRDHVREVAMSFKHTRRETWVYTWTGIEDGKRNGFTRIRKIRPEDAGSTAPRVPTVSRIVPQPSSWPSFIKFRLFPYGYSSGSMMGFVRAAEQARSPSARLKRIKLPRRIPMNQTALGRDVIWMKD